MTTPSLAEAALAYARNGWQVFPLAPRTKRPLGARGFQLATGDPDRVTAWWRETPTANIGCWPAPSGAVVIDVDGPEGEAATRSLGLLDTPTLTCITGRPDGGRHLYYAHPGFHVGNRALAPHLDVRGDSGYTILPPSVHPSGASYRWAPGAWNRAPLSADVARVLLELQAAPDVPALCTMPATMPDGATLDRRIEAYIARIGPVPEGSRNATAYRLAAWLVRDLARDADAAWGWLTRFNATHCHPPLPHRELRACLTSAGKHGRHTPGGGLAPSRAPTFATRMRPQHFGGTL